MKKYNIVIFSSLVPVISLAAIVWLIRNLITKLVRILGICKDFAGICINEFENVLCRGTVLKFSNLEIIALVLTAESFGFD